MGNEQAGRKCLGCGAPLIFIKTPQGKGMPCELPAAVLHPDRRTHQRHEVKGDALHIWPIARGLEKGTYATKDGRTFSEAEAPTGVELYLTHWARCPKAESFKKKKARKWPDD